MVRMPDRTSYDLMSLFASFGREEKLSLRDPKTIAEFMQRVQNSLSQAMGSDTLLYGQRTENMFEALVVSLGNYRLMKREDTGCIHPAEIYSVPDFRAVLDNGENWLIEVKNLYERDPSRQQF